MPRSARAVLTGQYQTRSYIDALGKRLASGKQTERDLEELASFQRSFLPAYEQMLAGVRNCGFEPSGRYPKTNFAIVAKLQREKTRLTTMQDIAGLRIVVANLAAQDEAVEKLRGLTDCKVKDRRDKPSGGYRAVHIIFVVDGYPIEVQVRTKPALLGGVV